MNKYPFKRLVLVLVIVIIPISFFWWLFYTTHGARFIVEQLPRFIPVSFEAENISGAIGGKLSIGTIRIRQPGLSITIDNAKLDWDLLLVIARKIVVRSFIVSGITIEDNRIRHQERVDLTWPRVPGWLSWLQGNIETLRVERLSYIKSGSAPVNIDHISLGAFWYYGILNVRDIDIRSPFGAAKGTMEFSFIRPIFRSRLVLTPRNKAFGYNNVSFDVKLLPANNPEQISGSVSIAAYSDPSRALRIECNVALTKHSALIRQIRLTQTTREGLITGEGEIGFNTPQTRVRFHMTAKGLDFSPEFKITTNISGTLDIMGNFDQYQGRFSMENHDPSWKSIHMNGDFSGTPKELKSITFHSTLLEGTVDGKLGLSWLKGFSVYGRLKAKNLNPAKISPNLQGTINADLDCRLQQSEDTPLQGTFNADLLDSQFQGKALTGKIDARFDKKTFFLTKLDLHGQGFDVTASGVLQERINYAISINDFSKIMYNSKGQATMSGWVEWQNNLPGGVLVAKSKNLSFGGLKIPFANANLHVKNSKEGFFKGEIKIQNPSYNTFRVKTVSLNGEGKLDNHGIDLEIGLGDGSILSTIRGGYEDNAWKGTVTSLRAGHTRYGAWNLMKPSSFTVSKKQFFLGPFTIVSSGKERLTLDINLGLGTPMLGYFAAEWRQINMAHANSFLKTQRIIGNTSGYFKAIWQEKDRLKLSGLTNFSGAVSDGGYTLDIPTATGTLEWDKSGLVVVCNMNLTKTGRFAGQLVSNQQAVFALPKQSDFEINWTSIDMDLLKPFLPAGFAVKGQLSGKVKGKLLPDNLVFASGDTEISGGQISSARNGKVASADINNLQFSWTWQDDALSGNCLFELSQYGGGTISFRLPFPARLPLDIKPDGPVHISAKGEVREKGFLTAVFPGMIQESTGRLNFNIGVTGSWAAPDMSGTFTLADAGAFLPSAGIRIKDVNVAAELANDKINITSYRFVSGSGNIEGNATIWLKSWTIDRYQVILNGKRFQAAYIPELQMLIDPQLILEGTLKKLSIKGNIVIPEAHIYKEQTEGLVRRSPDVVLLDVPEKQEKTLPFLLDAKVDLSLGDRVFVKAYGVDARLEGKITMAARGLNDTKVSGEIHVAKGHYKAYGVQLDIVRGRILFQGDRAELADLDVLAVRKIARVQAGVLVTGNIQSPTVSLYSDPVMQDIDRLSYIVLGKPYEDGKNQSALLMSAAGAILASGRSTGLQDRLKSSIGVDTLEVESQGSGITNSILTIGKFLSPELYVSFGRSLFSGENLFSLRYIFSKRWEIENRTGKENAIDIFYKIEFY